MRKETKITIKTLGWQGLELLVLFLVSFIFTGSIRESGEISIGFMVLHAIIYWLYDNLWFNFILGD